MKSIKANLTLHAGYLHAFDVLLLTLFFFFKYFFREFFKKHYQSVARFGSRSGSTVCPELGSICCKCYQQMAKSRRSRLSLPYFTILDISVQSVTLHKLDSVVQLYLRPKLAHCSCRRVLSILLYFYRMAASLASRQGASDENFDPYCEPCDESRETKVKAKCFCKNCNQYFCTKCHTMEI